MLADERRSFREIIMILVVTTDQVIVVVDFAEFPHDFDIVSELFMAFPVECDFITFSRIDATAWGLIIRLGALRTEFVISNHVMNRHVAFFIINNRPHDFPGMRKTPVRVFGIHKFSHDFHRDYCRLSVRITPVEKKGGTSILWLSVIA